MGTWRIFSSSVVIFLDSDMAPLFLAEGLEGLSLRFTLLGRNWRGREASWWKCEPIEDEMKPNLMGTLLGFLSFTLQLRMRPLIGFKGLEE